MVACVLTTTASWWHLLFLACHSISWSSNNWDPFIFSRWGSWGLHESFKSPGTIAGKLEGKGQTIILQKCSLTGKTGTWIFLICNPSPIRWSAAPPVGRKNKLQTSQQQQSFLFKSNSSSTVRCVCDESQWWHAAPQRKAKFVSLAVSGWRGSPKQQSTNWKLN